MRNFIDIINERLLTESVFFHPAVMTHKDGGVYLDWPNNDKTTIPCRGCEYLRDFDMDTSNCEECGGTGTETVDDTSGYPNLNLSNRNARIAVELLGGDTEDNSGMIETKDLPATMRRLISIKNGDMSAFAKDGSDTKTTRVDRSGEVPTIVRGPRMIDFGVSEEYIEEIVDRLIEIVRWAQQHDMVVSWA